MLASRRNDCQDLSLGVKGDSSSRYKAGGPLAQDEFSRLFLRIKVRSLIDQSTHFWVVPCLSNHDPSVRVTHEEQRARVQLYRPVQRGNVFGHGGQRKLHRRHMESLSLQQGNDLGPA